MAWTIGVKAPRNLSQLNDFFLIVGRALYCATAFEMKCRAIFRVICSGDIYASTPDFDAACKVIESLRDRMLHDTLAGITDRFKVKPDDAEKLDKARQARNYIAHEGSYIGAMFDTRVQDIQERLELLSANAPFVEI